jgi:hypothetical protein
LRLYSFAILHPLTTRLSVFAHSGLLIDLRFTCPPFILPLAQLMSGLNVLSQGSPNTAQSLPRYVR